MKRPSVDASLKPLKSFQRRTVEHAFHRLFTAEDGTGRFLVADEVGLGKTLVARGIIARAIDHLWNDVERIDIVYICSNGSIARANLPKLRVGGAEQRSFALATRLTMLATELAHGEGESGLAGSKLNFVSFTPGTSFKMGHSAGQGREREVLFQLLHPLVGPRTALMNFLQGWITKRDDWRWRLENSPRPIDDTIRQRFEAAFHEHPDLQGRLRELLDTSFRRYRSWPAEARCQRDQVISELRRVLAGACVKALEPDLVILDEFQRFKSLLDTRDTERDPAAGLAQELFQARAHDGKRVRTLLLSATPYKLYTADAEIEHEDHYEDFLATTRFLLGDDDARVEALKYQLSRFGAALRRAAAGDPEQVERVELAKRAVEGSLRDVMARTERVAASDDRDAMVAEDRRTATVTSSDVRQYLAADALFRAVGGHDPMPFWKSAPYLAHFMHGYKFNELVDEAINAPDKMVDALQRHDPAFLKAATLRSWGSIDPGHAKLRELVGGDVPLTVENWSGGSSLLVIHEWCATRGETPHSKGAAMKKSRTVRPTAGVESQTTRRLPLVELLIDTEAELFDLAVRSGLQVLDAMLEEDRTAICGPRYAHQADRTASRAGTVASTVVLGGRKVSIRRPRVRSGRQEVPLPTFQTMAQTDPLRRRTVEQLLVGVSTRGYARSLEPLPADIPSRSVSKSAVSRRFVAKTASQLAAWQATPLDDLDLVGLLLDGVHIGEHCVVVALGVGVDGTKHALGLWEGSTENATVCQSLLANLQSRGLRTDRSILVMLDGSKALRAAVTAVFGRAALVQRCQIHKTRNILDHLPERQRPWVLATLKRAYQSEDVKTATRLLRHLARRLDQEHPCAAASVREGLEETVTVLTLGLSPRLQRSLATTNAVESLISRTRHVKRNVKRWRGGQMMLRWVAAGVLEAAKGFRRLKGHADMPQLVAALRARDQRLGLKDATEVEQVA